MTRDDVHGLGKRSVRIAEHQYARGSKGAQQQRHIESAAQHCERTNGQEAAAAALNETAHVVRELPALKPGGVFRPLCRVAGAIGVRAHPRELAALHDQILVANRAFLEIALEDFPGACCVARLR